MENTRRVEPNHDFIKYSGRIDFTEPGIPLLSHPNSSIECRFTASCAGICLAECGRPEGQKFGVLLDGRLFESELAPGGREQTIMLAEGLDGSVHTLSVVKYTDGLTPFRFLGLILDDGGRMILPDKDKHKRLEFFGDDATAGAYEAADGGRYNAYDSYAAILSRMLYANLHNISMKGIGLLQFAEGRKGGIMQLYDKVRPEAVDLPEASSWDFAAYVPHVAVVAVGPNDGIPENYMRDNAGGEKALLWQQSYKELILKLRKYYPKALIILTTTILNHSPAWDRAIGRVCAEFQEDSKVVHFLYERNARFMGEHIAKEESEEMALELKKLLAGFGPEIWE